MRTVAAPTRRCTTIGFTLEVVAKPVSQQNCLSHLPSTGVALSKPEAFQLVECEQVIASGLKTFFEVGKALQFIRENRLYRQSHATFEDYCRDRWDMSRFYAHRLITASGVRDRLLTIGNIPLPSNEGQTRLLASLPEALAAKVWQRSVALAAGKAITSKQVKAAIAEVKKWPEDSNGTHNPSFTVKEERCYYECIVLELIEKLKKEVKKGDKRNSMVVFERMRLALERYAADEEKTESAGVS